MRKTLAILLISAAAVTSAATIAVGASLAQTDDVIGDPIYINTQVSTTTMTIGTMTTTKP